MLLPLETVAVAVYLSLALVEAGGGSSPQWGYNLLLLLVICCLTFGISWVMGWLFRKLSTGYSAARPAKFLIANRIAYLMVVLLGAFAFIEKSALLHYGWPMPLKAFAGISVFILIAFCWWLPQYKVHRRTMPGEWSLWGYLLFQVRYRLYILLLWFPLLLLEDVVEEYWRVGLFILPLAGIALFPLLIRHFWGCIPVENDLQQKLSALAKSAGVRVGGFYYWDIGGGMVNAAAVGLIYPFCYVFISRGLVQNFAEDELLPVVGHELGHLKRRHLLFHFLYIAAFFTVLEFVALLSGMPLPAEIALLVMGLGIYVRLVFGAVSRAFERQADLAGAGLCGTEQMCRALEKIANLHGGVRARPCWHHYSIAQRTAFLHLAQNNPRLVGKVNHQALVFMIGGVLCGLLLVAGSLFAWMVG